MKKIFFVMLLLVTQAARSEWITLAPDNIANIQIVEPLATTGAAEGLYAVFKAPFVTTVCTRRDAIVILDSKLVDRTHSALMFAMATNKMIRFYIDPSNRCPQGIPAASAFMLVP